MRQQVNLFQPILREEAKLFGASTALRAFAVVLIALAAFWAYGSYKVQRLEQVAVALREEQARQDQVLETASSMGAARRTPAEILARLKTTEAEVASRTRAFQVLHAGAVGRTTGFASRLEALARRHVEGVWIDRMAISGGSDAISLGGATLDPDLVPRYLQSLSKESVLAGVRFDQLAIERPSAKSTAQVRFEASSLDLPVPVPSSSDEKKEEGTT